jgi:ABC-type glycerol-3-phosphate transport system permease component
MDRQTTFSKETWIKKLIIYMLASLGAILVLFPIYWMLVSAIRTPTALFSAPSLVPGPFTSEHVTSLLEQTNFPRYYFNSIIVATVVTVISVICSVLLVYSAIRFKFRLAGIIVNVMLYAYMFPQILLAIPLYAMFVRIGLGDTLISLILSHCTMTFPLSVWLLLGFVKTIPIEIEEAALVDGASRFQAFLRVTLPLAVPGIITVTMFCFILSWADYVYALILVGTDEMKTVPLGIGSMLGALDIRWGEIMVAATLISLPIFIIFAFLSKYFIQGLTAGSIKG